MGQCRGLPRLLETACGPLGPEDVSWWNYVFWHIQRRPTLPGPPSSCWQILDPWRFAGLLYQCALQAKVLATTYSNLDTLCQSIAALWVRLAAEYIHKICHSFRHCWEAMAKKKEFKLNKWLANSKTHNNQKLQYDMKAYTFTNYSLVYDWSPHPVYMFAILASAAKTMWRMHTEVFFLLSCNNNQR